MQNKIELVYKSKINIKYNECTLKMKNTCNSLRLRRNFYKNLRSIKSEFKCTTEINKVRILVYDRDETFPNRVIHDLVYEWESACGYTPKTGSKCTLLQFAR